MTLFLTTVALISLIMINVPIAVAIVAIAGFALTTGTQNLYDMAIALYTGATSFPLIAIPLFILAGNLMNTTGISVRLINFISALIGFVRGGWAWSTSASRWCSPRFPARPWPTWPRPGRC